MYYTYRARCLNVVDGDTADLEVDLGFHLKATHRFRLLGIDTPEIHAKDPAQRERAQAAKTRLVDLLAPDERGGFTLRITTSKADSFGRWLADVMNGDAIETVSEILLREGHAVAYFGGAK